MKLTLQEISKFLELHELMEERNNQKGLKRSPREEENRKYIKSLVLQGEVNGKI